MEDMRKTLTPGQLAAGDPIENSIGMVLVPIPAGEFMMGSQLSSAAVAKRFDVPTSISEDEHPHHHVTLTKSFHLGRTEVTQNQWIAVMGTAPWTGKQSLKEGDNCAATCVSWEDAVEFCRKLSEKEGGEYRLPTEAEWEYACRAETTTEYSFGDDKSLLGEYAWYDRNAFHAEEKYAHTVGQKKSNPWGLYDMHGNVWEWCQDWFDNYWSGDVTDPACQETESVAHIEPTLFGFKGRITRTTYWLVSMISFVVNLIAIIVLGEAAPFLAIVFSVPAGWVALASQVKRLHDRGMSGWMSLVFVIPILGWLWALVELGFLRGTVGANRFGPDPTLGAETPDLPSVEKSLPVAKPVVDPMGPDAGTDRVSRGGCWDFDAWRCRSANRKRLAPSLRYSHQGFRVACSSAR